MKNYELTLIVSAQDTLSRIVTKIQESDGIVSKEGMKENNVAIIVFSMQPEKLEQFQAILKEDADVKRYMLIVKPQRKAQKVPSIVPTTQTPVSITPDLSAARLPSLSGRQADGQGKAGAEGKMELGEIDKKLEEIFKE